MRILGMGLIALLIFGIECFALAAGFHLTFGPGLSLATTSTTFAVLVGAAATGKGRDPYFWMLYGAIFCLIALVHVLVLPRDVRGEEKAMVDAGNMKKCPDCAEMIKAEARKCRYCGSDVTAAATR